MAEAAAYVVAAGNAHTHAMSKAATAEMADTYDAVVETHAVMDDAPPGTHAMGEAVASECNAKTRRVQSQDGNAARAVGFPQQWLPHGNGAKHALRHAKKPCQARP